MKIVVNPNKVKSRIEKEKSKQDSKKDYDPKDSVILKPTAAGKLRARAIPYVHNEDPSADPFAVRAYHYGIPGSDRTFYCPQENEGKKCAICDFVWGQMKESKGNKEQVKYWADFLPKHSLYVPVWVYDRSDEGVKLFRLSTKKNEASKWKKKIDGFWDDEETVMWMDPEEGFDLLINYEDASDEQKKMFRGAQLLLKDFELARKSSEFKEYEKALGLVPVLEDVYPRKTSEEAIEACMKWANSLGKEIDSDKDATDGEVIEAASEKESKVEKKEKKTAKKVSSTDLDDLENELNSLGMDD